MDGLRALFLGVSQSVFQQNGYTGLVLLFGIFLSSPWLGLAALLGLLTSTRSIGSWAVSIPLSAPFVCVLWLILISVMQLGGLVQAQGPVPGVGERLLTDAARAWTEQFMNGQDTASLLLNGTLRGISQILFQDDLIAGFIVLLGLLASSSRAAMLAAAGSLTGALTALLLIGAADPAVFHCVYGFNSALSALAVGTLIGKPGWRTLVAALLCAAVAAIATGAMIPLLRPAGLSVLSAPFCLASWIFLLALQERRPDPAINSP